MLEKLKYPKQYLNHGVWFFPERADYPIKRKIIDIKISFSVSDPKSYTVLQVFVEHAGWLYPEEVYMTRRTALAQLTAIVPSLEVCRKISEGSFEDSI